jgi:hypothetical protein
MHTVRGASELMRMPHGAGPRTMSDLRVGKANAMRERHEARRKRVAGPWSRSAVRGNATVGSHGMHRAWGGA